MPFHSLTYKFFKGFCLLTGIIFSLNLHAQEPVKGFFSSPLQLPLSLAGNFGEIRLNHFHYGLDFRTNNREGYPILSSADGYVSRVKISPYGYGKVIYIDHPNGFTTVYGHLSELSGKLGEHVRKAQFAAQKFEYEYYPKPDEFKVKKGEIIGLSGNSGGSQGPHLHFEIRHTKSEVPYNPLLFNLPVPDVVSPLIESISVYSFSNLPEGNLRKDHIIQPKTKSIKDTLVILGKGGIGFSGFDRESPAGSKNGIYEVILLLDTDTLYHSRIDHFSFEEARYVNCHIDYKVKKKSGRNIERTFLSANNKIPIYLKTKNRGTIDLKDTLVHEVMLIVKDVSGNSNKYRIPVRRSMKTTPDVGIKGEVFKNDQTNIYKKENIQVIMPAFTLYDNIDFTVSRSYPLKYGYSDVYSISSDEIPLQRSYILSIKPNTHPDSLKNKLTLVSVGNKGQLKSIGGDWVDGMLSAETKSFGRYAVILDTIAPSAKHSGFKAGTKLKDVKSIKVRASDNLGDIITFKGYIDNEWKLFDYDAKSDTFIHHFEEKPDGKIHKLKFECSDQVGNTTAIFVSFIR